MPSITEIVNFAPNKWFDNLSVPNRNSIYFNTYKKIFEKNNSRNSGIFIIIKTKRVLENHLMKNYDKKKI